MKNVLAALSVFFVLFVVFEGCNNNTGGIATMTEYHATPYLTEVEWDLEFGETAQMALYCETVYITAVKEKNGKIRLILKADRPN